MCEWKSFPAPRRSPRARNRERSSIRAACGFATDKAKPQAAYRFYNEEMNDSEPVRPVSIRRDGDRLVVAWNDGFTGVVPFRKLRDACPCATCNEKRQQPPNPLHVLSEAELKAGDPAPVAMPARGAYAYQVVWNDGHDSGIFKLELLRELCDEIR